jgi:hypothetical protein
MRGKGIAEQYRAKAARIRARLKAIDRFDLRRTVLGVAETYEAWAREIEKSAGEPEGQRPWHGVDSRSGGKRRTAKFIQKDNP